jgi:hypothetical protein
MDESKPKSTRETVVRRLPAIVLMEYAQMRLCRLGWQVVPDRRKLGESSQLPAFKHEQTVLG